MKLAQKRAYCPEKKETVTVSSERVLKSHLLLFPYAVKEVRKQYRAVLKEE